MNDSRVEDKIETIPYQPNAVQWHVVFDESPIGIVFTNANGDFIKCNKAYCDIVEYSEAELQQKNFRSITHPDDLYADEKMLKRCVTGEIPGFEIYKRYITKTGKVVWIRLTVWVLRNSDGQITNLCAHVQRMINGEKTKLEKKDSKIVYRTEVSMKDFIYDNIKTFIFLCTLLVTSFTTIGIAYWGAVNEVAAIKKQQEAQQTLLFKLYELIGDNGGVLNE